MMAIDNQLNNVELITVEQAERLGLSPLTLAQSPDIQLRVGDGATSVPYIEWLMAERERIRWDGDRQAEIVEDSNGDVSLWVNLVVA
jgi:hypothetical protein